MRESETRLKDSLDTLQRRTSDEAAISRDIRSVAEREQRALNESRSTKADVETELARMAVELQEAKDAIAGT